MNSTKRKSSLTIQHHSCESSAQSQVEGVRDPGKQHQEHDTLAEKPKTPSELVRVVSSLGKQ